MDAEEQEKFKRQRVQEECCTIQCNVLSIHGAIDFDAGEYPSTLTVSLVPHSFQRLYQAKEAVDGGVSVAGCSVRPNDAHTDLEGHKVRGVRLLLSAQKGQGYHIDVQCFCQASGCFFQGEATLDEGWFESVRTRSA
ncbi:hypothetical protein [Parendozoicomonas sp. Alg238-R29]|uniref:hypothetical protein n=1 Tax=Parendozoicomonas sp. Alg238-R29 TaxID=2993446 RepID=UPI00248D771C|nr:hypothetical protein [Parendozoicomonas sp. Alg238-R29]